MAEWFKDWFDSPYYHVLYKSRSDDEAKIFIDNLVGHLKFKEDLKFCDMACGRGRHSKYLSQKGFDVTGLDLSKSNIETAKASENSHLHFYIHDIRDVFQPECFDVILNLFTSFGYFEDNAENQKAVVAMAESLKPGGILVLDYMNSRKAVEEFNVEYQKTVDDIKFDIHKKIEKGYIYKNIKFEVDADSYEFEERVKLLFLEDFNTFFSAAGLELKSIFGNYNFESYQELTSDRLIMVCEKMG